MLGIFALGFRHGFDMDHVAAITDITGGQLVRLRALLLSTAYALGHAAMVVALGLGIAWAGWEVPDAGRLIGLTLVILGTYVLWCVIRGRPPRSRAGLLSASMTAIRDRVRPRTTVEHDHAHGHGTADLRHQHAHDDLLATAAAAAAAAGSASASVEVEVPAAEAVQTTHRHLHRHDDIPAPYGLLGAISVGLVHGIGAETPTQILALSGGTTALAPFLLGLFLANTAVAVVAVVGLTRSRLRFLNALVGAFSLYVGVPYLLGTTPPVLW